MEITEIAASDFSGEPLRRSQLDEKVAFLRDLSPRVKAKVVELSHRGQAAHLGSSLSCVDILLAAYFHYLDLDPAKMNNSNRDRFILSKGHGAMALYATLGAKGILTEQQLATFNQPGSLLGEHPIPNVLPGIEAATGSLGHGLSFGLGLALAAKISKRSYKTCVVLSDGECNEGSVWEAAMMAGNKKNLALTAVIDFNKWQATDRSQEVLALDPLAEKWRAFGWHAIEVDGHNFKEILEAFDEPSQKPKIVIAHTIKGSGVSFMQDDNNWHYRIPNSDELARARAELMMRQQ